MPLFKNWSANLFKTKKGKIRVMSPLERGFESTPCTSISTSAQIADSYEHNYPVHSSKSGNKKIADSMASKISCDTI